jgi:hypothetical protein
MSHKFAPRSSACAFLGYSPHHKGYCCMDLVTQRIIISRHVVFDESTFPFASPQPSSTATYEFLDDVPSIVVPPVAPHNPTGPPSPTPSPPPSPAHAPSPAPVHCTRSASGSMSHPLSGLTYRYSPVRSSARAALKDPNWLEAMTKE